MQLNFLQEDLLELMREAKPAAPAAAISRKPSAKKPAQSSLLDDLPAPPERALLRSSLQAAEVVEEKSPEAFKTISEAADALGVPAYVLRFWESQFPQIKPTKSRGGRRYYRPEDMEILSHIQHLLYKQGYTIKGAKKALSSLKSDMVLAAQPVPVSLPSKPSITYRQRSQLSQVRGELMSLREQLAAYL